MDVYRLIISVLAMGLTTAWFVAYKTHQQWGWRSALYLDLGLILLILAYAAAFHDGLFAELLLFGLVMGSAELVTDAWAVLGTRTLIYLPTCGPQIVKSPIWMPLGWAVAAVPLAFFAIKLVGWLGWTGLIVTGIIGALNLPFYEQMAAEDGLWIYVDCYKFRRTPYYVVFGEFLCAMVIGAAGLTVRPDSPLSALVAGLAAGVGVLLCSMIAYYLIEVVFRRLIGRSTAQPDLAAGTTKASS